MCNPYTSGTWDVWYSGRKDLWIEYKFIEEEDIPKRSTTLIKPALSSEQIIWGRGRYNEGRNLAVIVGYQIDCEKRGVIYRDLSWNEELPKDEFLSKSKSLEELAEWITTNVGKNEL